MRAAALVLALLLAGCAELKAGTPPEQMPRGFSQPGSPYPYNSPGW
jgi:hypothetical protein